MDLYIIEREGHAPRFSGTQADAKAKAKEVGGKWSPIKVPDRKQFLCDWLTLFSAQVEATTIMAKRQPPPADPGEPHPPAIRPGQLIPAALRENGAIATLARMEDSNVDQIVEIIGNASGYPLARYASAVAIAFGKLEGSKHAPR